MLVVSNILNDKERVVKGLEKRGFPNAGATFDKLIAMDKTRRELQGKLDETLAAANTKAREIGTLMKSGNKEKAEQVKMETAELKQMSSGLKDELSNIQADLQELLYQIPNIHRKSY